MFKRNLAKLGALAATIILMSQPAIAFAETVENTGAETTTNTETTLADTIATEIENPTEISIHVESTDIDITVPLNVVCNINPNAENGKYFTYGDLDIINNTNAPVQLRMKEFSTSDFEFNTTPLGLPSGETWNNLSVSQSLKYFALGIRGSESSSWKIQPSRNYIYSAEVSDVTDVGIISSKQTVGLDLSANHGLAFKESKLFTYNIVWIAELAE